MIDKEKEKQRNLRKYNKKRIANRIRGGNIVIGTIESRELREQGKKYCPQCKKIKTLRCFNKSKNSNFGHSSHCRLCSRELVKKYHNPDKKREDYKENKDVVRNYRLKEKFGITLGEYNKKLKNQKNKCMICGKTTEENGRALGVDHNHETGEVRDLLCGNCNSAVGFVQENVVIAKKIVKYIGRWSKSVTSQ